MDKEISTLETNETNECGLRIDNNDSGPASVVLPTLSSLPLLTLTETATVACYRTTPVASFRQILRQCLCRILHHSTSLGNSSDFLPSDGRPATKPVRYNHAFVSTELSTIDWRALCSDHDVMMAEATDPSPVGAKTDRSVLSEIVCAMTDPQIVPKSFGRVLFSIFFMAMLQSPRRHGMCGGYADTVVASKPDIHFSRWTPSQKLLLDVMVGLLMSDSSLSFTLFDFFQTFPLVSPNQANRLLSTLYALAKAIPTVDSNLVSLALHLLQRIDDWDTQQLTCEGKKSTSVVDTEVGSASCQVCLKPKLPAVSCVSYHSKPTRRRLKAASLSDLHDGELEIPRSCDTSTVRSMPTNQFFRHRPIYNKVVSLNDVLKAQAVSSLGSSIQSNTKEASAGTCTCTIKQEPSELSESTTLSADWSIVRSRAYKKFYFHLQQKRCNLAISHITNGTICQQLKLESAQLPPPFKLDESYLLHSAIANPQSPSWRVCLILLTHSAGEKGMCSSSYHQKILRTCWEGYELGKHPPNRDLWLRVYSEWLGECAFFDNREHVWYALRPLVQHVMKTTTMTMTTRHRSIDGAEGRPGDQENTATFPESPYPEEQSSTLLGCLGFIIMRRSRLFQLSDGGTSKNKHKKSSICDEFLAFINRLSIYYGDSAQLWLALFSDVEETRSLVMSSLQRFGILGLSALLEEAKKCTMDHKLESRSPGKDLQRPHNDDPTRRRATTNWPFSSPFTLRRALDQIHPSVLTLDNNKRLTSVLLSPPFEVESYDALTGRSKKKDRKINLRDRKPVSPMLDQLHNADVFCLIFSFCGFKRLVKIRQVCTTWKAIVDSSPNSLWRGAYVAKYGNFNIDTRWASKTDITICWKDLFVKKYLVERSIRHQRQNSTGYKYRTCDYLGCLHISKSPLSERKHNERHQRELVAGRSTKKGKKARVLKQETTARKRKKLNVSNT